MNLPEQFDVMVITLSDRAFSGEYEDRSGPAIRNMLEDFFMDSGWKYNIDLRLIPDNGVMLSDLLIGSFVKHHIIFTTGGTGIGPRDITIETVTPLLVKEIPGIMDYIRIKYGAGNPSALLSRGVAGIAGKSLIYTLPGSVRAVEEYMSEILKTLKHTIYMQYGIDTHN